MPCSFCISLREGTPKIKVLKFLFPTNIHSMFVCVFQNNSFQNPFNLSPIFPHENPQQIDPRVFLFVPPPPFLIGFQQLPVHQDLKFTREKNMKLFGKKGLGGGFFGGSNSAVDPDLEGFLFFFLTR